MATALVCLLAMMLDRVFGEPRRAHPLVAFGRLSAGFERALNRPPCLPRAATGCFKTAGLKIGRHGFAAGQRVDIADTMLLSDSTQRKPAGACHWAVAGGDR